MKCRIAIYAALAVTIIAHSEMNVWQDEALAHHECRMNSFYGSDRAWHAKHGAIDAGIYIADGKAGFGDGWKIVGVTMDG